jgi:glycerol 3-phosphatase-2
VSGTDARIDQYDLLIFDLDGVVLLGHDPIPGAVEAINDLLDRGRRVAYATNNASRRAPEVSDLLTSLGIRANADDVITSAQASATVLRDRLDDSARVLIVGGPALRQEVADVGLTPVTSADDKPQAVVQGYAPGVGWTQLAEACIAINRGAVWVATNADRTLPSPRGELPGNGSLVAALAHALQRRPDVIVGKPAPTLFKRAAAKVGAKRALVIGDRLDTDIAGGINATMDSLLVLSGVSTARDLLASPASARPTWVAADVRGLLDGAMAVPDADRDGGAVSGGWTVRRAKDGLEVDGAGSAVSALAALAAACWAGSNVPQITPASTDATKALDELHLA